MLVPGQKLVFPRLGKVIRLIDGHPDVGVSSPETIGRTRPRSVPRQVDVVVKMIGMLMETLVHEGVLGGSAPRLPVVSPRDDVPEMSYDRIDEKELPVLVPVEPPRVDRTMSQNLHHPAFRVVSPDPSVDGSAQLGWSSRDARLARAGMPTAPVEPTIRSPTQPVGEVVIVAPPDVETV